MTRKALIISMICCTIPITSARAGQMPTTREFTNSIGMKFVRIEAGTFMMGINQRKLPKELTGKFKYRTDGDADEQPLHEVAISKPFYMGICEVTNIEYEKFDPTHRYLRGKLGFSIENNEAVVFVSWNEAKAFCDWLSEKEHLAYRLPTEAEWEYACRAGTDTIFNTGDILPREYHKHQTTVWYPDPERGKGRKDVVASHVGKTCPNQWGLHDMHGNVEEWCLDWYGPYEGGHQADPVGRADGDFKVTRGGSHSTELYYLRSSNRMGAIPDERNWVIGFRVVIGQMPTTKMLPGVAPNLHRQNVSQRVPPELTQGADPEIPYFNGPRKYVLIAEDASGPVFPDHNHVPNIVECANGDLLAIWYTCVSEKHRELAVVASRMRYGTDKWEPATMFWDQPDRNDHTSALWCDENGTLYHFNGFSVTATWGPLAVILRTSTDNGRTWSKARLILGEHHRRQMPIESIFRTHDGRILLPCDAVTGGSGGTAIYLSDDNGRTWTDAKGTIAGIHACVAQLPDRRLIAFGRGDNIPDQSGINRMPMSISEDMGRSWKRSATIFPPVGGGQRPVMLQLKEGPVVLVSFTGGRKNNQYMPVIDTAGKQRDVSGMFAALSYDNCKTWANIRLITHDGPDETVETMDGRPFTLGRNSAEPGGYLSIWRAANGVIHLITSRQHYEFNLAWLKQLMPPLP